jgi:hypothetical protein
MDCLRSLCVSVRDPKSLDSANKTGQLDKQPATWAALEPLFWGRGEFQGARFRWRTTETANRGIRQNVSNGLSAVAGFLGDGSLRKALCSEVADRTDLREG